MARRLQITAALLTTCLAASVRAGDWPGWLGPNRDGRSVETGWLTAWPAEGPKVLWRVPGGDGISGLAVAGQRIFTLVQRAEGELAIALNLDDGKEIWATKLGPAYLDREGNGPRATPTVDGDRVYVQSVTGPLVCLEVATGKVLWQQHLLEEFRTENITWGLSASPLVEGPLVIAVAGAPAAAVVAFDKITGKLAWKAGDDKAAYSSPVAMTVGGKRQVITMLASSLVGLDAQTGRPIWSLPWKTNYDCNIATPLVIGRRIFVSSGESVGCRLLEPTTNVVPKRVWESLGAGSVLMTYWSTAVAHNGYLYGVSGEFSGVVNLNCVELATGKLVWSQKRFGAAGLAFADGHLFLTTRTGELVCVVASPMGYRETGRFPLLQEKAYITPTLANRRLYARDRRDILCVDLTRKP